MPTGFVVADGIGGHCAGDLGNRATVEALRSARRHSQVTGEMFTACLWDARARIGQIAADRGRPSGTTLSGVVGTETHGVRSWLIVNIGDSRSYLLNSDGLRQLSVDHTVVRELFDAGANSQAEASSHPSRNLLTRALLGRSGTRPTLAAADARWRPGPGLLGRTDERSR